MSKLSNDERSMAPIDLNPSLFWTESMANWLGKVEVLDSVDSTNSHARRYIESGHSGHYLCIANQQHSGRGRSGRQWVSLPDINLYASLVWESPNLRAEGGVASLSGLSLMVGLSIAQALKKLGLMEVSVKWPNDVKVRGKKIGGVLIELVTPYSPSFSSMASNAVSPKVIIGFGVNIHAPNAALSIDQPWTCLSLEVSDVAMVRSKVLLCILDQLRLDLDQFVQAGWASFKPCWESYDALLGKEVIICNGNQRVAGLACGVNDEGALLFKEPGSGNLQRAYSGDVRVRLATVEKG